MGIIEAIVLGIIQGLTEFLPVSSSGHLELGQIILGTKDNSDHLLFAVGVHFATALSTIIIYRNTIFSLIKGVFQARWNDEKQYALKIVISMIPVGIVGVFFEDEVEQFFTGNVLLVGSMLGLTGLLLLFTHFKKPETGSVSYIKSAVIGIAQAIAVMPGISRSGATIATSLLLGVDRDKAARFSFLMVLPPILGATLLKVKDWLETSGSEDTIAISTLTAGFIAAFLSGLAACYWMILLVKKGKLIYFAGYCIIIATIAIIWGITHA